MTNSSFLTVLLLVKSSYFPQGMTCLFESSKRRLRIDYFILKFGDFHIIWQTSHVMILLFQIAAEVAAPLAQCKKIVMVSNGKCDLGASKITGEILDIVANLPKSVEALTGIDISKVRIEST